MRYFQLVRYFDNYYRLDTLHYLHECRQLFEQSACARTKGTCQTALFYLDDYSKCPTRKGRIMRKWLYHYTLLWHDNAWPFSSRKRQILNSAINLGINARGVSIFNCIIERLKKWSTIIELLHLKEWLMLQWRVEVNVVWSNLFGHEES